ncbi:MAG: hypothetical protein NC218_08335 [Acetobacter sp.]|nr:hypothetical protein [Acetobacter sp.]
MMDNSELALSNTLENMEYYQQYGRLDYQAPVPTKQASPVRTDELIDVVDNYNIFKQFQYQNGLLSIEFVYFTQRCGKITLAQGSTELKEGYAFVVPAISNSQSQRSIRFAEENLPKSGEVLLFEFRINDGGKVLLKGDIQSLLGFYPYDATQYRSLSRGSDITLPHTAEDYECICIVGKDLKLNYKVNSKTILSGTATSNEDGEYDYMTYGIVYLKPGDELTSDYYSKAFKVDYNY